MLSLCLTPQHHQRYKTMVCHSYMLHDYAFIFRYLSSIGNTFLGTRCNCMDSHFKWSLCIWTSHSRKWELASMNLHMYRYCNGYALLCLGSCMLWIVVTCSNLHNVPYLIAYIVPGRTHDWHVSIARGNGKSFHQRKYSRLWNWRDANTNTQTVY